jgi:arylformamidase
MDRAAVGASIDEALEAQFALRKRHPERTAVYADFASRSEAFRASARAVLDVRYAAGPRCCLDVFPAAAGAPVFVFIHGGYWRALDRKMFAFLAEPFQAAGITVVMPSYDLAPAVQVADILAEMRAAVAWAVAKLAPSRLVVGGHSAGGHLAAMLAIEQAERGDTGPISALVGVSGAFDLVPLLRTSINHDVNLTRADAEQMSPLHRLAALPATAKLMPLLAVVGGGETDGFKAWTHDFYRAWRDRGAPGTAIEPDGLTHFTILEPLADARSDITQHIVTMATAS